MCSIYPEIPRGPRGLAITDLEAPFTVSRIDFHFFLLFLFSHHEHSQFLAVVPMFSLI